MQNNCVSSFMWLMLIIVFRGNVFEELVGYDGFLFCFV